MSTKNVLRHKGTLVHSLAAAVAYGPVLPLDLAADYAVVELDGGDVSATGTLTATGAPSDGDTVTIGLVTYTFRTALTSPAVANEVLIGGSAAAAMKNLAAAINEDSAGVGSGQFSEGTQGSPDVSATYTATTVVVTAVSAGTAFNTVATTEVSAVLSWGGATLSGGTDFTATVDFEGTVDGLSFFAAEGVPIGGGAAATSATAVGAWRINCAGLLGVRFPISAYTSGAPNVRFVHRAKSQG